MLVSFVRLKSQMGSIWTLLKLCKYTKETFDLTFLDTTPSAHLTVMVMLKTNYLTILRLIVGLSMPVSSISGWQIARRAFEREIYTALEGTR